MNRVIDSPVANVQLGNLGKGTYNVVSAESAQDKQRKKIQCQVVFLDGDVKNFELEKRAKGSVLLNEVFKHLDLIESDYFGLQYSDAENTHCMRWLDPEKSLKKQLLSSSSRPSSPFSPIPLLNNQCSLPLPVFLLRLRVKFYVSDPAKLQDEYTRYLLFLQIQHDIMENRLVVPTPIARLLASYVVQAELGDYNVEDFGQDHSYLSGLRMLPSQSVEDEAQIAEFHRRHRGQSPAMAEMNYLEAARRLEMYGVDLHQGRDAKGKDIQIGVTGGGLVVFHHRIRVNTFSWAKIIKLSFKRRHFLVTLKREASESYDTILVFDLMTYRSCKSLWKSCVEHHTFFRLPSAPARSTKRSPFPLLGSKFRYSGRTELQTIAEGRKRASERHFSRQSTARLLNRNSVPSLPPPSSSPLVAPPPTSNGSSHTHPSPPSHPSSPAPPSPESATTTPVASPPPSPSSSSASALEESVRSLPSSPSINLPVSFSSPSSPASLQSPLHCPTSPSQISALPDDAQLTDDQRQPEDTTTKDGSTQPNDLSAPVSTSTTDVQETEVASEETEVTSVRASSETDEDLTPRVQPLTQETLTSMTQETLTSSSTATEGEEPSPLPSTEDLMPPPPPSTLKSIPLIQQLCGLSNGCGESKGGLANGGLSVISGSTAMSGNSGIGLSSPSTRASSSSSCSPNKKPPPAVPPRDANATELPTSPRRQDASAPVSSPRCMSHEGSNVDEAPLLQPPTSLPLGLLNGLPSAGESLASSDCTTDLSDPTTGFVTIRITPDEQGRFGFNVRGGVDQNKPVIVSRVAPNMAADRSYPRLNEGDQVLFINGRDISGHTHDQVVSFIRSSTLQGILELIVKPSVMYVGDDSFWDGGGEEPEFSYVPLIGQGGDKEGRSPGSPPQPTPYRNILRSLLASNGQAVGQTTGARALAESMLILAEGIEDGSVIRAFETLYRRKPGMRSDQCKAMDNLVKNRYRDICPYDDTRVTLRNPPEAQNDYINANHITIEVPDSVPPANYIGCQAPLPNTMGDFWTMAFENSCPLIMMVTVIAERGRVKSHKYWPNQGDTLSFPNGLSVTCKRETDMGAMTIRDFLMVMDYRSSKFRRKSPLVLGKNKEEKSIIQIMFKTWPDHGVPESPKDFLNMVYHMRKIKGMNANPVIVHCSAGIGRTGVLILMDVALSMIDAKIPVYPVEIVETMREQRALLVQTSIQFRFCCEAILRVYTDGELKYRP